MLGSTFTFGAGRAIAFASEITKRSDRTGPLLREDYPFAPIALAHYASMDGDILKARALLAPLYKSEEMHISEAIALFTAQTHVDLDSRDIDVARRSLDALRKLTDDDHPNVVRMQRRIDLASRLRRS